MIRNVKTFALAALVASLLSSLALAEDPGPLLERVRERLSTLADASFLLRGTWTTIDGARIAVELDVRTMPGEEAISVYVLQPDALADDMVVLQGDDLFVYSFLINQVTIYDADDPSALSGLLGQTVNPFDAMTDLAPLLEAYDATVEVSGAAGPYGPSSTIVLIARDGGATFPRVQVGVAETLSVPYALDIFDRDDRRVGTFALEELVLDQGLTLEDVTYLPGDADVLDERRD